MSRRFYIGGDIGDAETIFEFSITGTESVQPATMPGKNAAGQAIPTLYGYDTQGKVVLADTVASDYEDLSRVEMNFKRRPTDLVFLSAARKNELLRLEPSELWKEPEFAGGPIQEYAQKLATFIDIILLEPTFMERAMSYAAGCDDCVICVGHPTNWDEFDTHIYRSILEKSVLGGGTYLGLPMHFTLECESRAAFLYIKNVYQVQLEDGEYVGLMDVGSSTIDVSVLTKDSRSCVYDSGSNFLGARSIDYLVFEYYIERACPDEQDKQLLDDILQNNPAALETLLLNCRLAKETVFSATDSDKSRVLGKIIFADFRPFRLTYDDLVNDICNRPIAPVLNKYCALPQEHCNNLGSMGWKDAFRQFVLQQVEKMKRDNGIELNKLFLTGSASRMDFVRSICLEVLPQLQRGDSLFDDVNPSNAIAQGLARVGASEYKASAFQEDMDKFFDKNNGELLDIIKKRIPDLVQDIADPVITLTQNKVVIPAIQKWKNKEYKTLKAMMDDIKELCQDEKRFGKLMQEDAAFLAAMQKWTTDKVGNDIALALQRIATKHNVFDFSIKELNAFANSSINMRGEVDSGNIDVVMQTHTEGIVNVISVITAIASVVLIPVILGVLIGLSFLIVESVAITILTAIATVPGAIVVDLAILAGAFMAKEGVKNVYKNNKDEINAWLMDRNLPQKVRERVKISELAENLSNDRGKMIAEMEAAMKAPKTVDDMSRKIHIEVYPQVEARANQIKYEIVRR